MSEASPPRDNVPRIFQSSSASASRLVHLIPDELAGVVPDHPVFSYPKTTKPQDGFVDVSSNSFANGVNRTSWYLASLLGLPKNFETVCYIGPSELSISTFLYDMI